MFELDQLRKALILGEDAHAERNGRPRAAVASIVREASGASPRAGRLELLFIERSRRFGDPWSGHMAFPGGRAGPEDAGSRHTAERETHEEIGLDLSRAEHLGRLETLEGRRASGSRLSVAAHVYLLSGSVPELELNYEVADVVWLSTAELVDPERYVDYRYPAMPFKTFPGVRVGDGGRVIWGLTHRFLTDLFSRVGQPFPVRPDEP